MQNVQQDMDVREPTVNVAVFHLEFSYSLECLLSIVCTLQYILHLNKNMFENKDVIQT
jgi:hypothetical protein